MNPLSLIPAGMNINDLTIAALGFVAFITVVVVWGGLMRREPSLRRIRDVTAQRHALAGGGMDRRRRGANNASGGLMRRVVLALNLLRTERAQQISLRMASAGWRKSDAVVKYLFAKLVLPFAFGLGTLLWLNTTQLLGTSVALRALAAMAVTVFGFMLPEIWIKNAVKKRQVKIQRQIPDAIDLMVTCAEAGLSLGATLQRVSAEFEVGAPEVADELSLTCVEMEFLPDRGQALINLADRVGLPSVRSMVNTLLQSAKFGTPLSQALRVLSAEFRDERILKAEEKAARLPALMTVPMVLFILPSLFVVLIGPAVLRIMDQLVK
jgi:tight adherence protein C